jgi:hypothetical protein
MSDTATKEEEQESDTKKRRPRRRWVLGAIALVAVIVVAVVALSSGGDKKPAAAGGDLKAGKQALLPLSASGKLAGSPGQQAAGKGMRVRSVVKGQGFWIGGDKFNRVYVEYGGLPGIPGSQVNLAGVVKPAPGNTQKTLKLSQEDAAKVTAEGAYIHGTKVSPAQ